MGKKPVTVASTRKQFIFLIQQEAQQTASPNEGCKDVLQELGSFYLSALPSFTCGSCSCLKITAASPGTASAFQTGRGKGKPGGWGAPISRRQHFLGIPPYISSCVSLARTMSHDHLKLQYEKVGILVGHFVDQNIWVKVMRKKGRTDTG